MIPEIRESLLRGEKKKKKEEKKEENGERERD